MHSAAEPAPGNGAMNKADHLIAGGLSVLLALWLLPFARLGFDPHHDGIMLKPALDVLSGQTLFRDTFMQYGALSCYLQVGALAFQPTLLALKWQTVLAYAVTLYLLYATWRTILPRSLVILSCVLCALFLPAYEKNWLNEPWILTPWSSVLAMLFQVWALHATLRIIHHDQARAWSGLLGVAVAATFWCRQPVGIVTAGAVGLVGPALWRSGWRPAGTPARRIILGIVLAFLAVNAVFLATIALTGSFDEWWYQNFEWPRRWARDIGSGESWWGSFHMFLFPRQAAVLLAFGFALYLPAIVRRFGTTLPANAVRAYFVVIAIVCAWQHQNLRLALSWRDGGWTLLLPALIATQAMVSGLTAFFGKAEPGRAPEYFSLGAIGAVALSALAQYYPAPDAWHVFWSLAPGLGLAVYVLWRWSGCSPTVVTVGIVATLALSFVGKVRATGELLAEPRVTLESPVVLRGIRVRPAEADMIGRIDRVVSAAMQHRPDVPAVMSGNDALLLCTVRNLRNPSPYFIMWPGLVGAEANRARWAFIAQERPLIFLHKANWSAVNDFYRRDRYVPLLYLPEIAMEIAAPQELADAMGLKAYGANPAAAPVTKP